MNKTIKIFLTILCLFISITIFYPYTTFISDTICKKFNIFLKPILIIKYINQRQDKTNDFINDNNMITDILREKYHIVNDQNAENYDIIIDGAFGHQSFHKELENDPDLKFFDNYLESTHCEKDNRLDQNPKAVKLFFTEEAVKLDIEKYDLSIGPYHIDNDKYIRIPVYYFYYLDKINANVKRGKCNPHKPVFACFLADSQQEISLFNNLPLDGVKLRDRLFHLLSLYKHVESNGRHLNNLLKTEFNGKPKKIVEWLSRCKFMIVYENQKLNGYITEKPFQAYFAGSIPIYYADHSITSDINTDALIWVPHFKNEGELIEYIKQVDSDDELYCKIWNQQLLKSEDLNYNVIKNKLRKKLFQIIFERLNK